MLCLKLIVGSTREGRAADHVLPWLTKSLATRSDLDVEVLDLRNWDLPMFRETFATVGDVHDPTFSTAVVKQWNNTVAEADAYLFLTPEYNHSIPAVLKNAIDSVFATFAFRNKPFGTVAYSGSIAGGTRAVEHLALIGVEAEMVPLRNNLLFPYVHEAFDEAGDPINPKASISLDILLEDLAWWAGVLRSARDGGGPPPAFMRQMAMQTPPVDK